MTIKEICQSFSIAGKYLNCEVIPTGNINSTYRVNYDKDGEEKTYVLQRINKNVFTKPEEVMSNIVKVTHYIRQSISERGLSTKKLVLRAFLSKETGDPFVIDDQQEYWRCYRFIKNSVTYDTCTDLNIIRRAGEAFGKFQSCLDGFNAKSLYITIPDFHNTIKRYEVFHSAVEKDEFKRAEKVKNEIDVLNDVMEEACKLQTYLNEGALPLRVTHNDTKCNNVSFDKTTGEALAVLDLDTVMPGAVAHDFGDAIRFIANTVIEDEPNVDKVSLDMLKYEAFAGGFVAEVKDSLTTLEKKTLNLGVLTITAELAVRFLTDYLNGDKYFKTNYPGHNLDRARNQIALAQDVARKMDEMDTIIQKYL